MSMYRISIYRELDPMPEQRTKFAFKGKREHIAKVNISNLANSNQHVDTETSDDSRDTVTVSDTVKITFNLDIESKDKKWSTAKIAGQALVKKKVLMLGSKKIDTINNTYIYDTRIFTWMKKKKNCEKKLL